MKLLIFAVLVVTCNAALVQKRAAGDQNPKIRDALKQLRGGKDLTTEDIQNLVANAVPGTDYPINSQIPESSINCSSYNQPGYYADTSSPSNCQVFHRCDQAGLRTDYICGNGSLFNQITLVCDWFYNIDCAVSAQFVDYSNSRLNGDNVPFLDDQPEDVSTVTETVTITEYTSSSSSSEESTPARANAQKLSPVKTTPRKAHAKKT